MTRLRSALILLLALAWNVSSPWLALGRTAPPEATVISSSPLPSAGSEWLPSAAAGEQLARLPGHQAASPAFAAVAAPRPATRPRVSLAPPPPAPRDARRRPHMLRGGSTDPDEPS